MTSPPVGRRSQWHRSVVVVALAANAASAFALGNDTVFLRANALVRYDSNVFLISNELELPAALGGPQKSDLYYGLGAGIRLDLPVSRQRFRVDASATNYSYSHFDQLDYTGFSGRATWDWRVGNQWHGQIGGGASQTRRAVTDVLGFTVPRLLRTYDALANVRYALTPRWELQGGGGAAIARYDDETFREDDFERSTWDLGAAYKSPSGNSTGLRFRYERGRWPNRSQALAATLGREYEQYTLSAVLDWQLTGRSKLYGDVGYTVRARESALQGDFDGPSGRLTYDYALFGKTTLRAAIFETRGPTDHDFATYVRTRGLSLSPIHELTAKILLQGELGYREVDFLGTARASGAAAREFQYWYIGLGGVYQITRVVYLGANLRYDWRTSEARFGDYEVFTGSLSAGTEF